MFTCVSNLQTVYVMQETSQPQPFGFTIYNSSMFWADWQRKQILQADTRGEHQTTLVSNIANVMDITVFHNHRPNGGLSRIPSCDWWLL